MMQKPSADHKGLPKPQVSSNKQIALMPPGKWRVEGEPGLYLYTSPDGQVRRWIFRFTSPTSKKVTEAGLDMATNVSLAQAKAKAQEMRRQIAAGIDPIQAKRGQRTEQVTFGEACTAWIEIHKSSWKGGDAGSQMRSTKLLLHHHGAPLAKVPVQDITPDMIQAVLEKLWSRTPLQGRRTLAAWERVLDFARAKGLRTGDNPASWRGMFEYRFPKVRATDRGHFLALPYEQMPEFMKELRARQKRGVSAICLEFVILTACRSGEALRMRWEEIDWDKCLWTIPAERMSIFHFGCCLEAIKKQLPRSQSLSALVDRVKIRDELKRFSVLFPHADSARHAIAHAGEMFKSPEWMKQHGMKVRKYGPGFAVDEGGYLLSALHDRTYSVGNRGEVFSVTLDHIALSNLRSVNSAVQDAFKAALEKV